MDIRILGRHEGRCVQSYILRNRRGMEVEVLNLGGIVKRIEYRGRNRILGFDNYRDYLEDKFYIGAVVGPVSGRIGEGEFYIDDRLYNLSRNDGRHSLHGGEASLAKKVWRLYSTSYNGLYESFTLKYRAEDGEGGYPGNRDFFVSYTLNNDNEFIIEYKVRTDRETYVSPSNQIYFNFNDDLDKEITNHSLSIDADSYMRIDEERLPFAKEDVEGTIFDFREGKKIGPCLDLDHVDLRDLGGYNHPFILNEGQGTKVSLNYKDLGLDIETTEPVVVVYTANDLRARRGIRLETQGYPDGINRDFLPLNSIKADEEYYSRTIYNFK